MIIVKNGRSVQINCLIPIRTYIADCYGYNINTYVLTIP